MSSRNQIEEFVEFVNDYSSHVQEGKAGEFLGFSESNYYQLEMDAYKYYSNKQFDKAQTMLEGILSLSAERSYAQLLFGEVLMAQGDIDGALKALRKAEQLEPNSIPIMIKLAELHLKASRHDEAKAQLTKIIAIEEPPMEQRLRHQRAKLMMHNLETRPLKQDAAITT